MYWSLNRSILTGYANEVGESFRSLVPNSLVRASYGVATVYTVADTADKSYKMYKVCKNILN